VSTSDLRAPRHDIMTNARLGSLTALVDETSVGAVEDATWTAAIVAHEYDAAASAVVTPTCTTDLTANSVTMPWTTANMTGLLAAGAARWSGYFTLTGAFSAFEVEIKGRFVADRNATASTTAESVSLSIVDETVSLTAVAAVAPGAFIPYSRVTPGPEGRALVADPDGTNGVRIRYPSPKGVDLMTIGTSIDLGSGGDYEYNAVNGTTYLPGYPSNADIMLHICATGRWEYRRNSAVGGDTLGSIGHLLADAPIGSTTLDVALDIGPTLPRALQTVTFDYGFSAGSTGPATEACYATAATPITGGTRLTLLGPTTAAHTAGDTYRSGMIGRFEFDIARFDPDVVIIGGPYNDRAALTAAQLVEGQQLLAKWTLDADAVPVVATMLPATTNQDTIDAGNAAIRANAATRGHWLWDAYRTMVNPANREQQTELTRDATHPNQDGAALLAQSWHEQVGDRMEIRTAPRRRGAADGYVKNCVPNGTFSGGSTGTGLTFEPVGWTVYNFFGGGMVNSLAATKLTDDVNGQLLRVTASGSGNGGSWGQVAEVNLVASGSTPGWAPGDEMYFKAFVRLSGFVTDGNCVATLLAQVNGTDGSVLMPCFYHWARDFEGIISSQSSTVSTAVGTLTSIRVIAFLLTAPAFPDGTGRGTLEVGSVTVGNMTAGDV